MNAPAPTQATVELATVPSSSAEGLKHYSDQVDGSGGKTNHGSTGQRHLFHGGNARDGNGRDEDSRPGQR